MNSEQPSGQSPPQLKSTLTPWRIFLLLAALQTLAALAVLLREPSEAASQLFLGLSPVRMAIAIAMLAGLAGTAWLLTITFTRPERAQAQVERLAGLNRRPALSGGLIVLMGLIFLAGCHFLVSAPGISEPFSRAIYARLAPLVFWAAGLSGLSLIGLLGWIRFGTPTKRAAARSLTFWLFLVIFGLVVVLWTWVTANTLKAISPTLGWYPSGPPLIETQVLLAWLIGMGVWWLTSLASQGKRTLAWLTPRRLDVIICLVLWGGSITLWNSIPLNDSYFHTSTRPPNNEIYPNSDAMGYDMTAQQLLIGEGAKFFDLPYVRRPMLALLLTASRLLGGQDYAAAAFWQITVLALFPALVYLLTRTLHSPLAGVMTGVMIVLREANSIAMSRSIATSHAKLFMSDLPAALAVAGFLYFAVAWLKKTEVRPLHAVMAGGMLGIAILIRTELISLLFALGLFYFLSGWKPLPKRMGGFALVLLGSLLVTAPWIYRNYALTGQVFLDTPSFHLEAIQERYKPTPAPTLKPPQDSPASLSEVADRLATALGAPGAPDNQPGGRTAKAKLSIAFIKPQLHAGGQEAGGFAVQQDTPPTPTPALTEAEGVNLAQAWQAFQEQPADFTRPFLSHLANSQIQFFLVLPATFRPIEALAAFIGHRSPEKLWSECCTTFSYARRQPYWKKWDGMIPREAFAPLVVNFILIAAGLAAAWRKNRWAGLLPLAVFATHITMNALARNSGGRYILSVVWIALPYFGIGLAEASLWAVSLITGRKASAEAALGPERPAKLEQAPRKPVWKLPAFYGLAVGLVLLGSVLPVLEKSIPQRYTAAVQEDMLAGLLASDLLSANEHQALSNVLASQGAAEAGLALFPRHYPADKGEISIRDPFHRKPFAFTGFYMVNEFSDGIVLPMEEPPARFPNAVDTLLVSCPDGTPLLAALYAPDRATPETVIFPSLPEARLTCPAP